MNEAKDSWSRREVIELPLEFGEHVAEQCTGRKLTVEGELNEWMRTAGL